MSTNCEIIDSLTPEELEERCATPYGGVRNLRVYQQSVVLQDMLERDNNGEIPNGAYCMDKPYGFEVINGERYFK